MYTGKLILTNRSNTPHALSNNFDDTFGLIDCVKECKDAKEFCGIVNKFHRYETTWSINKDNEITTRLKYVDPLGNILYLIATKTKPENTISSSMKSKIFEAIISYNQTDDEGDIDIAREKGNTLCSLLKEIITQV